MKNTLNDFNHLQPLAERLCAAYISAQMGFSSVDYVIKRYVRKIGEPPSPLWFEIAAFVSDVMTQVKPLPGNPQAESSEGGVALRPPAVRKRQPKKSDSKKSTVEEN